VNGGLRTKKQQFGLTHVNTLCLAGSPIGQPSCLCSVLLARAPVLGLCFFVSVNGGLNAKSRSG